MYGAPGAMPPHAQLAGAPPGAFYFGQAPPMHFQQPQMGPGNMWYVFIRQGAPRVHILDFFFFFFKASSPPSPPSITRLF